MKKRAELAVWVQPFALFSTSQQRISKHCPTRGWQRWGRSCEQEPSACPGQLHFLPRLNHPTFTAPEEFISVVPQPQPGFHSNPGHFQGGEQALAPSSNHQPPFSALEGQGWLQLEKRRRKQSSHGLMFPRQPQNLPTHTELTRASGVYLSSLMSLEQTLR